MAERDDAGEHSATSASRHAAREPGSGAADRRSAKRREARPQRARGARIDGLRLRIRPGATRTNAGRPLVARAPDDAGHAPAQRLIDTVTFVPSFIVMDFEPPFVDSDTHFTWLTATTSGHCSDLPPAVTLRVPFGAAA